VQTLVSERDWRVCGRGRPPRHRSAEPGHARATDGVHVLSRLWRGFRSRSASRAVKPYAPRPFGGPLADSRASRSPGGGDPERKGGGPAPALPVLAGPPLPGTADGRTVGGLLVAAAPPPPAAVRCCSLDARFTAVSWSPPYTSSRHTLSCRPYRPSYGAGLHA